MGSSRQPALSWDYPRTSPPSIGINRAGHIVREVGRQELDHLGAILDGPEPPQCNQLGAITVALNAARNDRRHDPPGRDHAGRYTICGDPERAEILG